jgi:uncharacterized FlaG/YvyC family protein
MSLIKWSFTVAMEAASRIEGSARPPVTGEQPLSRSVEELSPDQGRPPPPSGELSAENLNELAKELQDTLRSIHGTKVQFGVHVAEGETPNDIRFRITNEATGEVVREFPPEKVVDLARNFNLKQAGKGLLIDSAA